MMIRTEDLKGSALNLAVSQCEGYQPAYTNGSLTPVFKKNGPVISLGDLNYLGNWSLSGPIIEREGITVECIGKDINGFIWQSTSYGGDDEIEGDSYLVAAMRCYVSKKLGHELDVPDALVSSQSKNLRP